MSNLQCQKPPVRDWWNVAKHNLNQFTDENTTKAIDDLAKKKRHIGSLKKDKNNENRKLISFKITKRNCRFSEIKRRK